MVILGVWEGRRVTLSIKPNCLTVSLEQGGQAEVFSYENAGRLWTALFDQKSYRRGLDGKLVAKWITPEGKRQRRWLEGKEALQIESRAGRSLGRLWDALRAGTARLDAALPTESRLVFERALAFDARTSLADAANYRRIYKPVGILPPDQYMSVVLQATEGCSFNTCTFCTFYQDRPFRIKLPDEFKAHAEAVRDFIGEGLSLRRTIFLGDANALVTPLSRLLSLMDIVHQVYDVEKLGGIFAFLDGFSGEKKTSADYSLLRECGLKRVYLVMESGNAGLLRFLKKPGGPEDVVNAVRSMKAGGVAVGVIVLLGAGGKRYDADHVRDTAAAINAMELDLDDLIYFSELVVNEGMQYYRLAYQANLEPLTAEERDAQGESIFQGLKFSESGGMPHISRYDIREFVY
jgi:hypothetical protein